FFFFSSRRRHTRWPRDWSSDVCSSDLVSERMVQSVDVFIGYRTNPHLDMRERGAEAAAAIREMLDGVKPQRAFIRLPIVPPTVKIGRASCRERGESAEVAGTVEEK